MIIDQIRRIAPPGTVIPKPKAKADFRVKGIGTRRGEDALIYTIPNHRNANHPYEKGITISEFEKAYQRLINSGRLTRRWFTQHMKGCDTEGPCNFTTIGGLFELLSKAVYEKRGVYRLNSLHRRKGV